MTDDFLTRFRKPPRARICGGSLQKDKPTSPDKERPWRSRLFTASVLAMLLVIALLLTNPRCKHWLKKCSSSLLLLRATGSPWRLKHATPEVSASPTYSAPVLAGCEGASAALTYPCVVGGAEAALGFNVRELPSDPAGFTFSGVSADPARSLIGLTYARDGGELTITQIHGASAASVWESTWDAVPRDFG